jgi:hypothetical protein
MKGTVLYGSRDIRFEDRPEPTITLYESVGFRHVKPESLPPMPYSRADVFMEMPLE